MAEMRSLRLNIGQLNAINDAVQMLQNVDDYSKLPAYGRGQQYAAMARTLHAAFEEEINHIRLDK